MAYCHFELCRDCGLGCFSELLLADTRRLSVVAVVFLYEITVYFYNNTQQHHFWNFTLINQIVLQMTHFVLIGGFSPDSPKPDLPKA